MSRFRFPLLTLAALLITALACQPGTLFLPDFAGEPEPTRTLPPPGPGQLIPPTAMPTPSPEPAQSLLPDLSGLPSLSDIQPISLTLDVSPPYTDVELEMLARINDWRIQQGLWPLAVNDKLTDLAMKQAQYLITIPDGPEDYHADASGAYPRERAFAAGWPYYDNEGRIAVGEVAAEGSVESALQYWNGSQIHHDTVLGAGFREIGVAAVPYRYGYLFIAFFGGRPDWLPALVDPATETLFLSTEQYKWAPGDRMQAPTHYQLLLTPNIPLSDSAWQAWQPSVPAPTDYGDAYAVAFSDGTRTTIAPVEVAVDIAWRLTNESLTTVTVVESAAAVMARLEGSLGDALLPGSANDAQSYQPDYNDNPTLEAISGQASGIPDITLIYGDYSMTILNNPPGDPLDISGLELVSGDLVLAATDWQSDSLQVPLDAFTVGSCLQTWDFSELDPGVPQGCGLRALARDLPFAERFWLSFNFEVHWRGDFLRMCPVGPATCEIILP